MKRFAELFRNSTRTAKFGVVVIILWIICALFAPLLAPCKPDQVDILQRLIPPSWENGGSLKHVFGTDEMGRDVLSRLLHGARVSIVVGFTAVLVGSVIGTVLGLLAGFVGGWIETVIMRMVDVMLSFPFIFLALTLMAVLGSSLMNVIIVLGITGWVPYTRMIHAQVLSIKEREFVKSSHTIGCTKLRVVLKHIMPNVIDSAIILATMEMGTSILAEASLTFLGLGVPPSIPTWGNMIATGRQYIFTSWWLTTIPGLAIFFVCLSINFVGDWLRDIRDPRLRGAVRQSNGSI